MKQDNAKQPTTFTSLTLAQLQTILSGIPEALLLVEADSLGIVTLNQSAEKLVGRLSAVKSPSEWIKKLPSFVNEYEEPVDLLEVLSGISDQTILELHVKDNHRMYELSADIVTINSQRFLLCKLRDITHRLVRREQTLRFVHSLGHELKQPLGLIRAYTYYIKKNLLDIQEQIHQYPEKINQQVDVLTRMLNNIVDTTKLSTALITLNLEEINLVELIESILADVNSAFPHRKFTFKNPKTAISVTADSIRLREAILNVLMNAIKYSEENQPIAIALKKTTSSVVITITDKGIGIPSEHLNHIFEPYFRTTHSKSTGVKGLGLGLSLVREIIKLHHGSITVTSRLNQGSTFTISLPANTA